MYRLSSHFLLVFLTIFLSVQSVFSQNLELVSGPSLGRFWSWKGDDVGFARDYGKPHAGYFIGVECSNLRIDSVLNFKVGMQVESYEGDFYMAAGSHGFGVTDKGNIKKTILGISFYPFNLKPLKTWNISLGVQLNVLIDKELNGIKSGWSGFGSTATSYEYEWRNIDGFLKNWNVALVCQSSYAFYRNNWILEPRINATVGVSNEIPGLIYSAYHFRVIPALGIGYVLGSRSVSH